MKYIDISPPLSAQSAVFPGDVPFRRDVSMDFELGDHLGLSSISSTLHLGAHVDAPNHYHRHGQSIDKRSLHYYLGHCQVVSVKVPRGQRIGLNHFKMTEINSPRVLFKTMSFPDPHSWNNDFNSLSPELVRALAKKGVILVGIDTPSIDLADDKILESHNAVYLNEMAVLEGIVLKEVADGFYTLIALPLKISEADASPVRAVLIKDNGMSFGGSAGDMSQENQENILHGSN